jgi:alkylhydroperoxidase/carboxymuconolactone decarboxylase family protein YurZ
MIHLGAAMALGCDPCMQFYRERVDEVGLTDDEINAIESIVMAVAAGKVKQQFNEVLSGVGDGGCDDGCSE